jgi:uncharacterized Zn-binding protein involved in type VI secretion
MARLATRLSLCLMGIALLLCLTTCGRRHSEAPTPRGPSHSEALSNTPALPALLVDEGDVPADAVLHRFDTDGKTFYRQCWFRPARVPRATAGGSITIYVQLCGTSQEAEDAALRALKSAAIPIPEVTGSARFADLGDRVWSHGSRLVAICGTVMMDVFATAEDPLADPTTMMAVAKRLHERIVSPPPAEAYPCVPLPCGLELNDCFRFNEIVRGWGGAATKLILPDYQGLLRAIPAKRVGDATYLVPLHQLRFFLDPASRVTTRQDQTTVTIKGKECTFVAGKASVTVDGATVALPHAVEIANGKFPLVPLEFVKAVGYKPVFGKHGNLTKVTLTPLKPSNLSESSRPGAADRPIWHLLAGQDAIPRGLMLYDFSISRAPSREEAWRAIWFGRLDPHTGLAEKEMIVSVTLCQEEAETERVLNRTLSLTQAVLPEVSGTEEFGSFTDRAWHLGRRLLFTRRTAVVSISVVNTGDERADLLRMGREIGQRVDRLASGRPDPIPAMPLAVIEDMELQDAWELADLTAAWGAKASTLVIEDSHSIPRSVPAKRVDGGWVVPLDHLAAFLGTERRVRITGDTASISLKGKECRFVAGKASVTVDGKTVALPHAVEFAEGKFPLVPLDFVKAVGYRPVFGKYGDLTKVTLTPLKQSEK